MIDMSILLKFKSKVERQIEWSFALCLLLCLQLLAQGLLICRHDLLCVEMLELIVLWHEAGKDLREGFYLGGEFQLFHETLGVLLEFLRFDFLVRVDLIDSCIQLPDLQFSFLVLELFVFR